MKNPEAASPPQAGLGKQKAKYPEYLQETFHGRRFISTDPVEFLDYDGSELLLIGAHDARWQMILWRSAILRIIFRYVLIMK